MDYFLFIYLFLLICCGIVVIIVDLRKMIIPDSCIFLLVVNRIALLLIYKESIDWISVLAVNVPLLIWVLFNEKKLHKEIMGYGDIKLLFAFGLYTNTQENIKGMMYSCLLGLIFGLVFTKIKRTKEFPFGPCLVIGYLIVILSRFLASFVS